MNAIVAAPYIRLAGPADADDLAALFAEFRDFFGDDEPSDAALRAGIERLLADPATEFLLAGDPPFGVAALRYRYGVWRGGEDCCLEDLFVREAARGDGVGRALVEAVLARARERGCVRIELDVNEANEPAVALYESVGFSARRRPGGARNLFMRRSLG